MLDCGEVLYKMDPGAHESQEAREKHAARLVRALMRLRQQEIRHDINDTFPTFHFFLKPFQTRRNISKGGMKVALGADFCAVDVCRHDINFDGCLRFAGRGVRDRQFPSLRP